MICVYEDCDQDATVEFTESDPYNVYCNYHAAVAALIELGPEQATKAFEDAQPLLKVRERKHLITGAEVDV